MWKYYALLSAFFAALTTIFVTMGLNKGIDSNLATAIRTSIILLLTWGIVAACGHFKDIRAINGYAWLFLLLSGVSTGLSWLFYFKALQAGETARVASIDKLSLAMTVGLAFLIWREEFDLRTIIGAGLITAGGLIILIK